MAGQHRRRLCQHTQEGEEETPGNAGQAQSEGQNVGRRGKTERKGQAPAAWAGMLPHAEPLLPHPLLAPQRDPIQLWGPGQSRVEPTSPQNPRTGRQGLPRDPKRLTGAGRRWWAGGLLAPRPGWGSQARSELPRADARCLCERAHILRIPGSRPEIPQSYILHIWFQLGSGEGGSQSPIQAGFSAEVIFLDPRECAQSYNLQQNPFIAREKI